MFCKKDIPENFKIFTRKHLCWSLFFLIKLQGKARNFIKKRLQHRCFDVNIMKFLKTPFLHKTSGRLLLNFELYTFEILSSLKQIFYRLCLCGCSTFQEVLIEECDDHFIRLFLNQE